MNLLSIFVQFVGFFLPWFIRVRLLRLLGMDIAESARVGISLIVSDAVRIDSGARVGSLNYISGISSLVMGKSSIIGNLNWVSGRMTAHSIGDALPSALHIDEGGAITNRHYIDCNSKIHIGRFATLAGVRSQIFTHSIDLKNNTQALTPVRIGDFSFVGSGAILLPGAVVPNFGVVSAGSVVRKGMVGHVGPAIYGGNPAILERALDGVKYSYFSRENPVVH